MNQFDISKFDISKFDRKKNICIEASAGTGKTYTVQQIVAKLLKENDDLSLENILIVTYTEKAAGELRDRIRAKLKEERLTENLAKIDNASIYTIHSFCKQTLSEFSLEANQCDNLNLIDEEMVSDFIEEWVRDELSNDKYFKQYYLNFNGNSINVKYYVKAISNYYLNFQGKEVPEIIQLDKSLFTVEELLFLSASVGNKNFVFQKLNFLINLCEKLNHPDSYEKEVTNQRTPDETKIFIKNLEILKSELEEVNKIKNLTARKKGIEVCTLLQKTLSEAGEEPQIVKLTKSEYPLSANDYFTESEIRNGLIPGASLKKVCEYFEDIKKKIESIYNYGFPVAEVALQNYLFEKYIPEIYTAWYKYKSANKFQTFDDMIRNVREAVCAENSKLKEALKKKYKYAIIDEFQDTNQKQWDIFKKIFMEDDDHSICVVGDPKQSIYSFQGADVNVYTSAKNEIASNNPENLFKLERNYRSTNKMIDFCNAFFSDTDESEYFGLNSFEFNKSYYPETVENQKPNATYAGKEIPAVWIPEECITDESNFAQFVVEQIIDSCSKGPDGKTKLQVYNKKKKKLSSVTFSDFTVLCKTKSEMVEIKQAFNQSGIPYNHYKEDNLFGGKECLNWISLFKAIDAPDFTSSNRKLLNACLFSSFFGLPLEELSDKDFDRAENPYRVKIIKWKKTAAERKWALLQEEIYEDSQIEKRLSKLDKLSSLTKIRQIGNYCVNYLYSNNCSIKELVDHLILLSEHIADADEEGGVLVEKGTDFDAVKIMTIHAAKGLDFPIVIAAGGFKQPKTQGGIYLYHDKDKKLHLTCDKIHKERNCKDLPAEDDLEYRRLFYVAYTRAVSIMIMPWTANARFNFLNAAFEKSSANSEAYLRKIAYKEKEYSDTTNRKLVQKILQENNDNSLLSNSSDTREKQEEVLKDFSKSVAKLNTYKLSYTKLAHGIHNEEIEAEDEHERNRNISKMDDNSVFDKNHIDILSSYDEKLLTEIADNYPKGSRLGEAVHQIFEALEFDRVGHLKEEEALADKNLQILIRQKFAAQGLDIDDEDSDGILKQTVSIIWNTMNAVFPEIKAEQSTGLNFSLKALADNQHFAELEFNLNPDIKQNEKIMRDYFNGFIDLLFVHESSEGQKIYSIVDWKTDSMAAGEYVNSSAIKKHTDEAYSIQRVLYSYCLIKWLLQFNKGKDENWIFSNLFGGIYYVYVRGCSAGCGNGIYAQTWESWDELEASFNQIVDAKISKGK